jgi:hypothetical protein
LTDFTNLSASAQQQSTVKGAIDTLLAGIAAMITDLNSGDQNVVTFAADLSTEACNLSNAAVYANNGAQKPLGGCSRDAYLEAAGV